MAFLIDVVVVAALTATLAVILDRVLGGQRIGSGGDALINAAAVLGILLFPFAWFVVGEAWFRATPGKALLGLEVTEPSGHSIGLRRAALRLLYRLSPVGMVGSLALLGGRPSWHERWTNTVVRRRGVAEEAVEAVSQPDRVRTGQRIEPVRRVKSVPATAHGPITEPITEAVPEDVAKVIEPTAMLIEAAASGAGLPTTSSVDCRCAQLAQLRGDEAAMYAQGHLLTVRRWPDAGHFALICPSTRLAWAASEGWGDDGEVVLSRVSSLAAAGPGGGGL